jgi:predicted aspartyl protease
VDAVLAVLPFVGDEPNRIYVDLAAEGSAPFVLLLDTGAAESVLTPMMARKLRVSVRRAKSTPYRRATRLGRDLQFSIDDRRSDTGSRTGWEYGLLGGEFLDDYVIEVDSPGRRVRFLDPERYEVPEGADAPDEGVIAFELAGTRITVPIELRGRSFPVMLDTGAPPGAILSGKLARAAGIEVESLPAFGEGGTTVGPIELRLLETDAFRFAGVDFGTLPLLVAPRGWYNIAGATDSALGMDLLRQFVMRIDYPRRRLWLRRSGDRRVTLYGADYAAAKEAGAFLEERRDAYVVQRIVPGGPAEAYGLRAGDAIVPASGEGRPRLDEVLARIRTRGGLTVARRQGDVWVDLALPREPASE